MAEDMQDGSPLLASRLQVRHVEFQGLKRTSRAEIEGELDVAWKGTTVRSVSEGLMKALSGLESRDCFEAVEILCDDVPDEELSELPSDTHWTDVTIRVKEKRMLQLKAETYVQGSGSEGGVETSMTLNNSLGYTEKLNGAVSYGTKSSAMGRIQLLKPKFRGVPAILDASLSHSTVSRAIYSSYEETTQGAQAILRHNAGRHELGIGSFWRDIIPVRKLNDRAFQYAASGLILAQAKPSLKNSIYYLFTSDSRDDRFGPSQGSLFQLRSEFAGFGGDVDFVKSEFKIQQFIPLLRKLSDGIALGFTFQTGILCPLTSKAFAQKKDSDRVPGVGEKTCILDRFWLGGPMDLRGFNHKGAGPRTSPRLPGARGGDSLGGDVTWRIGTNLTMPFPHPLLHAAGMRIHMYANAGNLCAWETSFRTLIQGVRASVGAGIVFPTSVGRIEANYSFVLRANSRDQPKRFQLGLGLDFL